jgi:hypothetical protein
MIKSIWFSILSYCLVSLAALSAGVLSAQENEITLQSASTLSWGPNDVLFVGDSLGATIYAIELDGLKHNEAAPINIKGFDSNLAAYLSVPSSDFIVNDMVVHGPSQTVFFAVPRGLGEHSQALIISMNTQGHLKSLDLSDVEYSKFEITDAPDHQKAFIERGLRGAAEALDIEKAGTLQRTFAITDIDYYQGDIFVAGLSNEEFSSTLRRIPFPFQGNAAVSHIEIFHAVHDQFETRAPVRTQVIQELDGKPYLIAAYTCTPLVVIPLDALKDGAKVSGKTVAELGFGNTPVDMVQYKQDDDLKLLLTNTNRNAMAFNIDEIIHGEAILEGVSLTGTEGVSHVPMPVTGALQLDDFDDQYFLGLLKDPVSNGLNLYSIRKDVPLKLNEFFVEYDFPGYDRAEAKRSSIN